MSGAVVRVRLEMGTRLDFRGGRVTRVAGNGGRSGTASAEGKGRDAISCDAYWAPIDRDLRRAFEISDCSMITELSCPPTSPLRGKAGNSTPSIPLFRMSRISLECIALRGKVCDDCLVGKVQ